MNKWIAFLLFLTSFSGAIYANCGAASCPLNNHHYLKAGWMQIAYLHDYINQDQIYKGSNKSFAGASTGHHDELQTINERQVIQVYGALSDRLSLDFELPFISRQHSHILHEAGEDIYETWRFNALGDVVLSGHYAFLFPATVFEPYLSLTLGIKMPSGITDIRNDQGKEAEITIQPGSGSADLLIGLNYRQTFLSVPAISGAYGALPLIAGITYRHNGKGTQDWQFGREFHFHIGSSYQFLNKLNVMLQFNTRFQGMSHAGGSSHEHAENTGGLWIYASPGLNVRVNDTLSANAWIQLPVYQNVNGVQQTSKFNLNFGLTTDINLLD
jgi:hypothetical protein